MRLKYRDDLTPEEQSALLAELDALHQCYADCDAADAAMPTGEDEDYECFDPVRDGWVGKDGRP